MARQARAELTRDAVLTGAAEVFLRLGYANASLIDIMTQANVTKGALYFHFGSKEELARAVVDVGDERLRTAISGLLEPSVPALEAAIGITYLVADLATRDRMVAAMFNLSRQIGDFYGTHEENIVIRWLDEQAALAKRAIDEGDLLPDLDAASVSRLWLEMTSGVRAIAVAVDRTEQATVRLERMWFHLLPGLVPPGQLDYFREFSARRSRRYEN